MKITSDTNILLRDVLQDDRVQSRLAKRTLQNAEIVAIPVHVFWSSCGFCAKGTRSQSLKLRTRFAY